MIKNKEEEMSPNKERVPPAGCHVLEDTEENSMANNRIAVTDDFLTVDENYSSSKVEYVPRIAWPDLIAQIFIHAGCVYGLYLIFAKAKFLTTLWGT